MKNKPYPYYKVPEVRDMKELLAFCADAYGEKTAFSFIQKKQKIEISFNKLKKDVEAFGSYLLNNSISDAHVALLGENSYEWIVAYFAVVNTGNIIVPLDKELSAEEIRNLIIQSDSTVLIHSNAYREEAEINDVKLINMKDINGIIKSVSDISSYTNSSINDDSVCTIVFTSGTTGKPKGAMLSHKTLIKDAIISLQNLYVPEGTVAILPLYHTFGWMACILAQIILGHGVFIIGSLKRVLEDIKYASPRHISAVPMLVSAIYNGIWKNAKSTGKDKSLKTLIKISNALRKIGIDIRRSIFRPVYEAFGGNLEMIISGGSNIDEKYIKGFDDLGIKLTNGYGITECSPIVATMRNKHYAPGSVGCVNPGLECRIVDGEIELKGDTIFLGYYKDEESTKEAFDGEWFRTGDLGYMDEDGLLYISGRKKNLIILSNGKNVSPEELESKIIEKISEVEEVLVSASNDKIVAEIYCESINDNIKSVIENSILEINRELPQYKHIAQVKFRDSEFPKTSTKKIKRN